MKHSYITVTAYFILLWESYTRYIKNN